MRVLVLTYLSLFFTDRCRERKKEGVGAERNNNKKKYVEQPTPPSASLAPLRREWIRIAECSGDLYSFVFVTSVGKWTRGWIFLETLQSENEIVGTLIYQLGHYPMFFCSSLCRVSTAKFLETVPLCRWHIWTACTPEQIRSDLPRFYLIFRSGEATIKKNLSYVPLCSSWET